MEVHIHIDDRIVRLARKLVQRRAVVTLGLAALLASTGLVYASAVADFHDGDLISASEMNAVLNGLDTRITALEAGGPGGPVSGYERIVRDFEAPPRTLVRPYTFCSPGKKVVGGAVYASSDFVAIYTSVPGADNRWDLIAENLTDAPRPIQIYVVCVDAAP